MIVFRADGNAMIGAGHIMRCLSIAQGARLIGEECVFVTASNEFEAAITSRGYKNYVLNTDYRDMESEDICSILDLCCPAVLFVDSYQVTDTYLARLKVYCEDAGITLVYVDDVLAFPYPCHKLLDYNIYGTDADYIGLYGGGKLPELLLGTKYAPLREEFQNMPERDIRKEAKHVLVSTGGADSEHMTMELVKVARGQNRIFHFVIGALNKDIQRIREYAEGYGNIVLHEGVSDMAELMCHCDVAISAAGSTLYELCATQTPTVTYILADNQIPGAEGFASRGIMKNCGDVRVLGNKALAEVLIDTADVLANDYEERARIAERMRLVVDGKGAERVIRAVLTNR